MFCVYWYCFACWSVLSTIAKQYKYKVGFELQETIACTFLGGAGRPKKQLFRRGKRYPKNQKFPFWMALTCWLSWRNNGLKCGYRGKLFSLEKSRNSNLNSIELLIFMKIKFIGLKCVWWLPRKMFTLNCFPHGLDSDHGGTEEPFVVARLRQLFHWPRTQHMSTFGFKVFYL